MYPFKLDAKIHTHLPTEITRQDDDDDDISIKDVVREADMASVDDSGRANESDEYASDYDEPSQSDEDDDSFDGDIIADIGGDDVEPADDDEDMDMFLSDDDNTEE